MAETFAELLRQHIEDPVTVFTRQFRQGVRWIGLRELQETAANNSFLEAMLQPLQEKGLRHLCLELHTEFSELLDAYGRTGDGRHLQEVIKRDLPLQANFPTTTRLQNGYFGIVREAQRLKIDVIAIDPDPTRNRTTMGWRNKEMVSHILEDGLGIFYCANIGGIGELLKEKRGRNSVYLVPQVAEEYLHGDVEKTIAGMFAAVPLRSSAAIDLRGNAQLREALRRDGRIGKFYGESDGIVYHPQGVGTAVRAAVGAQLSGQAEAPSPARSPNR